MTNTQRLFYRFRQFGGIRLVREYCRMGLMWECCKLGGKVLLRRLRPMDAYRTLLGMVERRLRSEFTPLMVQKEVEYKDEQLDRSKKRKVWFCWMQGLENAPDVVKVCYGLLCKYITDREIVVLTSENIDEYVSLPRHVLQKFGRGIIPCASYSDMLRLELLCTHGGTWIDATVLCTGKKGITELLDADLFVLQKTRKGCNTLLGMSSWMMSATANNKFLMVVRDMLYEYWREKDCLADYFMIHLFFCMVAERQPEMVASMPRKGNRIPHYLSRRLAEPYDEEWMKELKAHSEFHKLTYRISKELEMSEGTFYDVIIKKRNYG